MKKFSVWFFSLIVLFYSFASAVPVKASSPSSYQVDYSSLYSASDIAGILPTLTSSAAGGFFATLGSLAYSYLRSVNVNIVPSSSSMSPTDAMITLGKKVIDTVVDVTQPNRLLWKGLNSGTQYLVTSLLKDAQSGDLTESNYTDQVFVWKDQVSKPMSDLFNVFDPTIDLWSPDPEAFVSISSSRFSNYILQDSYVNNSGVPTTDFLSSFVLNPPFVGVNNSLYRVNVFSEYSGSSSRHSFDSILFFDNFPLSSYGSTRYLNFLDSSDVAVSSVDIGHTVPFLLFDSSTGSFFPLSRDNFYGATFNFYSSFPSILSIVGSSSYYLNVYPYNYLQSQLYFVGSDYDFVSTYEFFLGLSSSVPSYLSSSSSYVVNYPVFTSLNAFHVSIPANNIIHLSDLEPISFTPSVSIDASNNYVDRQLPIDNVDNSEATLNLASVIDNLAGSIDGTLSNIDFLTDAINGLVGTVPQVSVDAWNPDRVSEHVTSTDIASAIDGVASLEGTFTDNVQPVFDSFPLFPFIAPIWNTFQQFPVIGLITACIFLVVLFGFLNKLLF